MVSEHRFPGDRVPRRARVTGRGVLAAAFAIAGLVLALRALTPTNTNGPGGAADVGGDPTVGPIGPGRDHPTYTPTPDDAAVASAMRAIRQRWRVEASTLIVRALGRDAAAAFPDAAARAVAPLLTGSFEDHESAVASLGGEMPTGAVLDSLRRLWEAQGEQFAHRPVALDGASVHLFARDGVERDHTEAVAEAAAGGYSAVGQSVKFDRYPHVLQYEKRRLTVYEARVPLVVRARVPPHDRPAAIGVALAWDPEAGRWQPVQYRFYRSGPPDDGLLPQIHY